MKNNTKTIGAIITEFIAKNNRFETLKENQALALWYEICGEYIQSHCLEASVKRGILYLSLDSAALKNELVLRKSKIIQKMNAHLTTNYIKDVVIH